MRTIVNEFFTGLVNRSAEDIGTGTTPGWDYVSNAYQPVGRDSAVRVLATTALGDSIESRLYWVQRARVAIRNSSLQQYLEVFDPREGYAEQDIEKSLELGFEPAAINSLGHFQLSRSGQFYQEEISRVRLLVSKTEMGVLVKTLTGDVVAEYPEVSGTALIPISQGQEAVVRFPTWQAPCELAWSSRPLDSIANRAEKIANTIELFGPQIAAAPTILDTAAVAKLRDVCYLKLSPGLTLGAASVLISSHTVAIWRQRVLSREND